MDYSLPVIILMIFYALDISLLFLYGMHTYLIVFLYKRSVGGCNAPDIELKSWPKVTIQLPIFNEKYVIRRLLKYTTEMDYPKSKMEIQVLDDSTDETQEITKRLVRQYKKKGFIIKYYHRTNRVGHKGGALREALEKTKNEYVAIFDSDFLPAKEFLKKTVPVFLEDKKIGMVQTRWGSINSDYSMLTRAQGIGVDGHFTLDQTVRSGNGFFMNFNGTAGIWRKKCIIDAGNWQDDTLTEDFDLSYRAELRGWKFRYIRDVINPAELPATMAAYKSQQFRWCKGSIQTAVKLLPTIFSAKIPLHTKLEAFVHLTNYAIHPLMLINILITLPILSFDFLYTRSIFVSIMATLFTIATFGPMTFYAFAQKQLYPNDWKRRILHVPLMMIVGCGIAVNNTRGFIEAIIGKQSPFVRTPKHGITSRSDKWKNKNYHAKVDYMTIFELLFAGYAITTIIVALITKRYLVIPFLLIYTISFLYVSMSSIFQNAVARRAIRQSQTETELVE